MRWHGFLVSDFLSRVVAWSFISGMTVINGEPLLRTFKPHIHSWFQARSFSTNKSHPRSCLNRATWEHEKISQEPFLGNCEQVPGNLAKSSSDPKFIYMTPNSRKEQFLGVFHGTRFFTWPKTQVSAMFPRTFPGIETASSWDLRPACHGSGGGGWTLPRGPLDNQGVSLDD